MKERITITIDKELMGLIDERVDGANMKSRSHAIEMMLRHSLRGRVPPRAIILAAGKDEEMLPLTKKVPKAMLEVQGKPLLEHNIDLLKRYGVSEAIINIGHLGDRIVSHFGDGSEFGIKISYHREDPDEPLGTAGPLRHLAEKIDGDSFILLNADELKDVNLEKMYQFHLRHEGVGTIALTTVPETSRYGVAMLEGDRILRFVEKPQPGTEETRLINAGCYIFEPEVLNRIPDGFSLLANDVLPKLAREHTLYGYPFPGQWLCPEKPKELGTVEQEWRGFTA